MALLFPRLAKNFVQQGYFPTDELTLERILAHLATDASAVRLLDPCCGEGAALAEVARHLAEQGASVQTLGIDINDQRAWHAKQWLDQVAHSDVHNVVVTGRSIGLLFLNPPYGTVNTGQGDQQRADRLEKIFFRQTIPWLQADGILVLIVPHYVLDAEFAGLLGRYCKDVAVFMAPEQRFRQAVVLARKRRSGVASAEAVQRLTAVGAGELPPELPPQSALKYLVPAATPTCDLVAIRLDARQLGDELQRLHSATLWSTHFGTLFNTAEVAARPPLRAMTRWHLALALAAGQIDGLVENPAGERLLIKGNTFKTKVQHVEQETRADGSIAETRILTDKFMPIIKGISFTPGPDYGRLVTIL